MLLRARSANLSASICEVNEPDRSERPVRLSEFLGLACSANLLASICEVNEPNRSERPVRLSEFLGLARSISFKKTAVTERLFRRAQEVQFLAHTNFSQV